jgi:hypothetical protein
MRSVRWAKRDGCQVRVERELGGVEVSLGN